MDIQETKKASILDKHLDLGMIIDSLPIGVLVVDADGDFRYINDLIYKAWGADPSTNRSSSVHESYTGWWRDTGERVKDGDWAAVRALTRGESSYGEVIDILRFDGTEGAILNSAVPVRDQDGVVIGAIITISDITHMRKLEKELELHKNYLHDLVEIKTEELTEKNEKLHREIIQKEHYQKKVRQMDQLHLVGEMATGFAHEIRNPLTTVKGYLQLMSEKHDLAEYEPAISLMLDEIGKADQIITSFLQLAKDKTNNPRPIALSRIIDDMIPQLQKLGEKRKQTIKKETAAVLPRIVADPDEISEMILQLAQNGCEAMKKDETLTLRTKLKNGKVLLIVQDEGRGISEDIKDKAGTPFFTTKDHNPGLGMPICYSIAKRNGADINVESCPDGTTVAVTFHSIENACP
ncbi:hypothetical protein CR205_06445 [Alteribacter lacisalsi]|uniref:histidine kinase n=1 Tax=Alteribacter lacisalsi TaxID=2045244 RepID=A0A2W0HE04_9BACI|nr:ATP-binding protein [Alteribacter lacisalsi]PYZ98230.1 hypothetical protein CR205_06445 [Alteribacter lacisalsi]